MGDFNIKIKSKIIIFSLIICILLSFGAVGAADGDVDNQVISTSDSSVSANNTFMNSADYSSESIDSELGSGSDEVLGDEKTVNVFTFDGLNKTVSNPEYGDIIQIHNDLVFTDTLIINRDVVINGNGYTFDGQYAYRMFNITGGNVVLNNINFVNGFTDGEGGAIIANTSLSINNSSFTSCSASAGGGAIKMNGTCVIDNCNFTGNYAGTTGSIENGGGALKAGIYIINNSRFIDNSAGFGGAIFCNIKYRITNSVFYNSTTRTPTTAGSAIYSGTVIDGFLDNCTFAGGELSQVNNKLEGYIHTEGGTVNFSNLTLSFTDLNNIISKASGSCNLNYNFIYNPLYDGSVISGTPINSALTINGNGHVIDASNQCRVFIVNHTDVKINGLTFINSRGSSAIFCYGGMDNLVIDDCRFIINTCTSGTHGTSIGSSASTFIYHINICAHIA